MDCRKLPMRLGSSQTNSSLAGGAVAACTALAGGKIIDHPELRLHQVPGRELAPGEARRSA